MDKLVVIDSCMREESRTRILLNAAMEVLRGRYDVSVVDVNAMNPAPVSPAVLKERSGGYVPEEIVATARQIAAADRLVFAAPFWDMSFPAVLKAFIENMSLFGVTFTDNGATCEGLCRCGKVLYITTRGMNIPTGDPRDQGSSYLKALSTLWGLGEVTTVAAWNLDYLQGDALTAALADASDRARRAALEF